MTKKRSSSVVREAPAMVTGASRSRSMREQEEKWRAESDLRTLTEAEEICDDPKRHKRARALAKEKIEDLREVAKGKY